MRRPSALRIRPGILVIQRIRTGGPAEQAGIERGDVITAFDGKEVKSTADLSRIVAETPIGKTVTVRLLRKGSTTGVTAEGWGNARGGAASSGAHAARTDLGMSVDNISQKYQRQFQLKDRTGVVVVTVAAGAQRNRQAFSQAISSKS